MNQSEALGAEVAAIIGGIFSFLALVISKEQKTSEFRQAWIDALRDEVADFLVAANLILFSKRALERVHQAGIPAGLLEAETRADFEKFSTAANRIQLRLNPHDSKSGALLQSILDLTTVFRDGNYDAASAVCARIRINALTVVKEEWERVKNGEQVYRFARGLFGGLLVIGMVAMLVQVAVWSVDAQRREVLTPGTSLETHNIPVTKAQTEAPREEVRDNK